MSEFRPNDDALLRVKVTEVSGSSVEVSIPTRPAPEYVTLSAADLMAVPQADDAMEQAISVGAEAVANHDWFEYTNRCVCGERPVDMGRHQMSAALDAVLDAGLLVTPAREAESGRPALGAGGVPGRDEIVDEVLQHARAVITQYVSTAEVWRYERVVRAFAIMLGEIPEDAPEIPSPSDPGYDEWLRVRGASIEKEQD